jgi:hypothetical protein
VVKRRPANGSWSPSSVFRAHRNMPITLCAKTPRLNNSPNARIGGEFLITFVDMSGSSDQSHSRLEIGAKTSRVHYFDTSLSLVRREL